MSTFSKILTVVVKAGAVLVVVGESGKKIMSLLKD